MTLCTPQHKRKLKSRFATITNPGTYDDVYNINFSPDAPPQPVAPIARRATPYVIPPTQCTLNLHTNTVTCIDQSNKYLDAYRHTGYNSTNNFTNNFTNNVPHNATYNGLHNTLHKQHNPQLQIPQQFIDNQVFGSYRVNGAPDSPLNRVLTRQPTGPWTLVGYVVTQSSLSTIDRRMMLYSQSVDRGRNRYNYRATDSQGIPIDIGENVKWYGEGDTIHIESKPYTVHLYTSYR